MTNLLIAQETRQSGKAVRDYTVLGSRWINSPTSAIQEFNSIFEVKFLKNLCGLRALCARIFYEVGCKANLLRLLYALAKHFWVSESLRSVMIRQQGAAQRLKPVFETMLSSMAGNSYPS